jgi:hypothetical protein
MRLVTNGFVTMLISCRACTKMHVWLMLVIIPDLVVWQACVEVLHGEQAAPLAAWEVTAAAWHSGPATSCVPWDLLTPSWI